MEIAPGIRLDSIGRCLKKRAEIPIKIYGKWKRNCFQLSGLEQCLYGYVKKASSKKPSHVGSMLDLIAGEVHQLFALGAPLHGQDAIVDDGLPKLEENGHPGLDVIHIGHVSWRVFVKIKKVGHLAKKVGKPTKICEMWEKKKKEPCFGGFWDFGLKTSF